MKRFATNIGLACGLAVVSGLLGQEAVAQNIDFSKAEDTGNQIVDFLRGPLATIILVLAFAVAGFLAAMNRISWIWVGGIVLAAVLIFGGPAFVQQLRQILS